MYPINERNVNYMTLKISPRKMIAAGVGGGIYFSFVFIGG